MECNAENANTKAIVNRTGMLRPSPRNPKVNFTVVKVQMYSIEIGCLYVIEMRGANVNAIENRMMKTIQFIDFPIVLPRINNIGAENIGRKTAAIIR
jgi:hypothetical protein